MGSSSTAIERRSFAEKVGAHVTVVCPTTAVLLRSAVINQRGRAQSLIAHPIATVGHLPSFATIPRALRGRPPSPVIHPTAGRSHYFAAVSRSRLSTAMERPSFVEGMRIHERPRPRIRTTRAIAFRRLCMVFDGDGNIVLDGFGWFSVSDGTAVLAALPSTSTIIEFCSINCLFSTPPECIRNQFSTSALTHQ